MNLALLLITDGRKALFEKTTTSLWEAWGDHEPPIVYVVDDSTDRDYGDWLDLNYYGFEIIHNRSKQGFAGAIQTGWNATKDYKWLFHVEDDFLFRAPIELPEMISVFDKDPGLAQIVLKRQPWSDEEKAAGGIVECWPAEYTQRKFKKLWWTTHHLFFSTNPCLIPKSTRDFGWPQVPQSERVFTDMLLAAGKHFAFWGAKLAPPRVYHIGNERVGWGY